MTQKSTSGKPIFGPLPRQVKICEIWEPNEAEQVDAVLYASNVPLGMAHFPDLAVKMCQTCAGLHSICNTVTK